MSRRSKIYIRSTILFTLMFAIIASVIIGAFWIRQFFFGSLADLDNQTMQKSYVNALLCGVDKDGYRTDVLILAHFDLIENKVTLLQIPRDTYVSINKVDKKINSAYGYNKETQLFKEVEYILPGVKVDKFVLVNLKGFREIIDSIGGVEFDVPINMDYDDPYQDLYIHLKKGPQILDGKKAEQLVRFRKDNDGNDYSRGDHQKDFIYAAIDQILNAKNILKAPELISIATKNSETNFEFSDFEKYVPMVLNLDTSSMQVIQLPGEDRYENGGWYFIHDPAKTSQILNEHLISDREEVSVQELAIRNQLIGVNTSSTPVSEDVKLNKSILNCFLTVDIIDGSNGATDIEKIKSDIEQYGFNVRSVDKASTVKYEKTKVIAKKDNGAGDKIAKAIGAEDFIINTEKRNATSVTVIVGTDMAKKQEK